MNDAQRIDVDAIGEHIASAIDGRVAPAARLAERERLVRAIEEPPRRAWLHASVGALAIAAALVLWWAWPRGSEAPAPADPPIANRTSEWLQAPTVGAVALPVGEGASLSLHDGARGRVSIADDTQVGVALEAGTLRADVDPTARRHVVVEAGPHRVHVVGTVFAVKWSPGEGRFEVEVTRGKVEVHTPTSSSAIAVDAGRRLVAMPTGEVTLTAITSMEPELEPAVPALPEQLDDPPAPAQPRTKPRASAQPIETWESLAKAGKYADAFARIESAGFDAALASLPAASLEQLADVARLAGKSDKAIAAYTKLRARFGGTAAAARAAFQIGRLAHAPKDAVRWLETYLAEAPRGSFAKLARGRLVVALRDAGDREAARAAARVYVDSYPDGPHAKIAEALLASP
ncbi:MAG TPA: FecR domain-containing protein [Nannocystaceae bacterium]|nr:FecR domain-containing protein [Nannocystaceae bacterium]